MLHSEDLEPLAVIVEADAVVTQAEAQFQWVYISHALDISVACENVIGQEFTRALEQRTGQVLSFIQRLA
jgi:hypothetical protein